MLTFIVLPSTIGELWAGQGSGAWWEGATLRPFGEIPRALRFLLAKTGPDRIKHLQPVNEGDIRAKSVRSRTTCLF